MQFCYFGEVECLLIIIEGVVLAFMAIIVLRYSLSKNANLLFLFVYLILVIYYGLTLFTPEANVKKSMTAFYFPVSIIGAPLALICSIVGISSARMLRSKRLEYAYMLACLLSASLIILILAR